MSDSNKGWTCLTCTYINESTLPSCAMCTVPRELPNNNSKNNKTTKWACLSCTFLNNPTSHFCEICQTPSSSNINENTKNTIICPNCTTINLSNVKKCVTCLYKLSKKKKNNNNIDIIDDDIIINDKSKKIKHKKYKKYKQKNDKIYINNDLLNNNNNNIPEYINASNIDYGNINNQPIIPQPNMQIPINNEYYNDYNNFNGFNDDFKNTNYNDIDIIQDIGGDIDIEIDNNGDNNGGGGGIGGFISNLFGYNTKPVKPKNKKPKHYHKNYKNNKNNNKDNANDSNFSIKQFKDLKDIIKNDEEHLKKDEESIKILSNMYKNVYLCKKQDKNKINEIITEMMKFIPKDHKNNYKKTENELNEQKIEKNDCCQVCFDKYTNDNYCIKMNKYCYHNMICKECFIQSMQVKIKDGDVTPWLPCCAADCKAPINSNLIIEHLDTNTLYLFASTFIRMHLARNSNWIFCNTKKCDYGFILIGNNNNKNLEITKKCEKCNKIQKICKNPLKNDKGYQQMLKNGILRTCPKCELPTMKDKGMCNVMQCGKCGIWWNWRTRETGTNSKQLKNKARMNGTLWEPGELQYQLSLQRKNPDKFKKLLESNGIEYKSNYVRGRD